MLATALFYATPVLYPITVGLATRCETSSRSTRSRRSSTSRSDGSIESAATPAGRGAPACGGPVRFAIATALYVAICVLAVWVFNREAPRIAEELWSSATQPTRENHRDERQRRHLPVPVERLVDDPDDEARRSGPPRAGAARACVGGPPAQRRQERPEQHHARRARARPASGAAASARPAPNSLMRPVAQPVRPTSRRRPPRAAARRRMPDRHAPVGVAVALESEPGGWPQWLAGVLDFSLAPTTIAIARPDGDQAERDPRRSPGQPQAPAVARSRRASRR